MKKLVKFVPLVILLATLGGCYFSCGPIQIGSLSYTLTDSALPDINVQVTPFIPPRALNTLSGWVRVDVTIGTIHFSTDDPRFKCFESLVPFIIADDFAFPGFYIAVYDNCLQSGYSRPASGAMMTSLPLDNQVAVFEFPRDNSLCSQGQCILPLNPLTPTPTPSPTPSPTPTLTPPMLSVVPGNFNTGEHCSSNGFNSWVCSEELTNTGGGTLNWTASNSDDAEIRPPSGTLSAGQSTMLIIDFACDSANFTLTFSGPTNTAVALVQVTNIQSCH